MNYKRIYDEFISDRKSKEDTLTSFETHHILPKSLGGKNINENYVKLSVSDHIFAHQLLHKIHGGGMTHAFWMMTNSRKHLNKKSRFILSEAREKHNLLVSKRHTNKIVSEETRKRRSDTYQSKSDLEKQIIRDKISIGKKGYKQSIETKEKISKTKLGTRQTDESNRKRSDTMKGVKKVPQKRVECPYCKKVTNQSMGTRFHFANCKMNINSIN